MKIKIYIYAPILTKYITVYIVKEIGTYSFNLAINFSPNYFKIICCFLWFAQ